MTESKGNNIFMIEGESFRYPNSCISIRTKAASVMTNLSLQERNEIINTTPGLVEFDTFAKFISVLTIVLDKYCTGEYNSSFEKRYGNNAKKYFSETVLNSHKWGIPVRLYNGSNCWIFNYNDADEKNVYDVIKKAMELFQM